MPFPLIPLLLGSGALWLFTRRGAATTPIFQPSRDLDRPSLIGVELDPRTGLLVEREAVSIRPLIPFVEQPSIERTRGTERVQGFDPPQAVTLTRQFTGFGALVDSPRDLFMGGDTPTSPPGATPSPTPTGQTVTGPSSAPSPPTGTATAAGGIFSSSPSGRGALNVGANVVGLIGSALTGNIPGAVIAGGRLTLDIVDAVNSLRIAALRGMFALGRGRGAGTSDEEPTPTTLEEALQAQRAGERSDLGPGGGGAVPGSDPASVAAGQVSGVSETPADISQAIDIGLAQGPAAAGQAATGDPGPPGIGNVSGTVGEPGPGDI